jgi:hypothetical protein
MTSSDTVFNKQSRTSSVPGPYHNTAEAYSAGKTAALGETET